MNANRCVACQQIIKPGDNNHHCQKRIREIKYRVSAAHRTARMLSRGLQLLERNGR